MFLKKKKTLVAINKKKNFSEKSRNIKKKKALLLQHCKNFWNPFLVEKFKKESLFKPNSVCLITGTSKRSIINHNLSKHQFKSFVKESSLSGVNFSKK